MRVSFFFFNDTATTEIYTLSLHDALPISVSGIPRMPSSLAQTDFASCVGLLMYTHRARIGRVKDEQLGIKARRSEEHTSELQSPCNLVCRLLLEKNKKWRSPQAPYAPGRR